MPENRCVCCGEVIPEGWQVCPSCEKKMVLKPCPFDSGVTVQELDGCEYCKEDSEGFRRMFGAFSLVNPFHGKTWQIHAGKCKPREINFCPMCGRRLFNPPKGE